MSSDRPWHINKGKPPRAPGDTLIECIWANGTPARHLYQIHQLRWELDRGEFAIGKYRRAL